MFAKISTLRRIAGGLSAKYASHTGGDAQVDPPLDSLRARLAALSACYATLDELALDFAAKMEAAARAAAAFGAALRAATADIEAALPPQGGGSTARSGSGDNDDDDDDSNHPSKGDQSGGFVQLMNVAADILENLDATRGLRTLLTGYRAFLSVFTEVTLVPLLQVEIPRVEKLKVSADQAYKRAKNAELRATTPVPQAPAMQSSSSLSAQQSLMVMGVGGSGGGGSSSFSSHRPVGVSTRPPSVQSLHHSAKAEYEQYRNELAGLLDSSMKSCARHRELHVQRLVGLCRDINETLQHLSSTTCARCTQAAQQIPIAAASLVPTGPAFSYGGHVFERHPMSVVQPADSPSSSWSVSMYSGVHGGSDPLLALSQPHLESGGCNDTLPIAAPEMDEFAAVGGGTVDWIELWAELKFLADMRAPDDEIRKIYASCSAVEPAILPNVEVRYMTLEAPADSAVEVQSLDTPPEIPATIECLSSLVRAKSEPARSAPRASFAHTRMQYIIAKGTNFKNLKHIVLDLNSTLVFDRDLGMNFHSGFYKAGRELYDHVKPKLNRDIPIKIVGHSMGGAAACICALLLQRDGYLFDSMHTFGAPRFTDHAGAERFRNKFGMLLLRVCHYHDIVRTRPAPSRFKHVGRLVVFHDDDAVWYLPESPSLEPAQNASFSKGFNSHRTSTYTDCVRRQLDRILGPEMGDRNSWVRNNSDPISTEEQANDPLDV